VEKLLIEVLGFVEANETAAASFTSGISSESTFASLHAFRHCKHQKIEWHAGFLRDAGLVTSAEQLGPSLLGDNEESEESSEELFCQSPAARTSVVTEQAVV
jgi:hypothetical protein